jgi:ParB family transcriptional regulator, chromosome partitioning protein
MKAVEKLTASLGANIQESMGSVLLDGAGERTPAGPTPTAPDRYQGLQRVKGAFQIPPDRLAPDPNQPRKEFAPESLAQLAQSLQERGQLQPIRVRWDGVLERWVIIAGERRWRAAVQAKLPMVTAVEASGPLTESEILEEQLIENCLREDLKPIEQAKTYQVLLTSRGLSQRQLAERLRISQATIARSLALLHLPDELQVSVESGELAPNAAYQLSKVADPAEQQQLARASIEGRLKRDELDERTRPPRAPAGGKPRPWTHTTERVKVTLSPLAGEVSEEDLTEALRSALKARAKKARGTAA